MEVAADDAQHGFRVFVGQRYFVAVVRAQALDDSIDSGVIEHSGGREYIAPLLKALRRPVAVDR